MAENDDLTLWDLEIEAYNTIPTTKKRLVTIGGSTHMDAVQQPLAADAGRDCGSRMVLRAPGWRSARRGRHDLQGKRRAKRHIEAPPSQH